MQNYHRRIDYTYEEKVKIVEYIVRRKSYNGLRGNLFWQEMESRKILPRTWQSMKEHFKKKIVDIIHTFHIPDEEKRLIKEGWETSRVVKQDTKKRKTKRPVTNIFSDEEDANSSKEKSKKGKHDEHYSISDGSDSSASSLNMYTGRKKTRKPRNTRRRSPSEFNVFSDEEDVVPSRKNKSLSREEIPASCSKTNKNEKIQKSTNSKQVEEPSSSGLHHSYVADSDSGGETIVNSDILRKHNKCQINNINDSNESSNEESLSSSDLEEFSMEEDMLLLQFIKSDKIYLERRKKLEIYEYFHEIYPNTKSPKLLKKRFLKHLLPNICEYSCLTIDEMKKFYMDADMELPENLKRKLQVLNSTSLPSVEQNNENVVQTTPVNLVEKDLEANISEHNYYRSTMNSLYCHITLNGKPHIFVSDVNSSCNEENLPDFIAKKFKIDRENIHYINFESCVLLEQINKFRNSLFKQYENIIVESLKNDYCENVNVKDVIAGLEICFKMFSSDDEDSSSSDDEEEEPAIINSPQNTNTHEFCPTDNSTPHKRNSQIISEENKSLEIKDEQLSSDEFSGENVSLNPNDYNVSDIGDTMQIKLEPYSESNHSTDISETIDISDEEQNQEEIQLCRIKDEISSDNDSSEYLESVPTQGSTEIRNTVTRMAENTLNVNNSAEETIFHRATGFSQNLR